MLYLCRICALPTLLNTVVLLFNLVKRGIDLYIEIQKLAIFYFKMGGRLIHGVDLYTVKYGIFFFNIHKNIHSL